jgi:hypothetical protein
VYASASYQYVVVLVPAMASPHFPSSAHELCMPRLRRHTSWVGMAHPLGSDGELSFRFILLSPRSPSAHIHHARRAL